MKKRIMSLLLALLMVISVLPMPTFAEGTDTATVGEAMQSSEELGCCCPENYDTTNGHAATCPLYTCPDCGAAGWHETCPYSGDIGKYAVLNSALSTYSYTADNGRNVLTFYPEDFTDDAVFIITGWRFDAENKQLWYKADFYSGGPQGVFGEWSPNHEMLQNGVDGDAFIFVEICDICGKPACDTKHTQCGICGNYGCTELHFYCEHCDSYTCTKDHLFCIACGELDCETAHLWCGICAEYDCGETHVDAFKPATAPIIPASPAMTPGAEVSIADENGNAVSSLSLAPGQRVSLSAWSAKGLSGVYQWQIRYDAAEDLWANIQGQTGKGIIVSPGLVNSVISASGSAALRCTITSGDVTEVSAAIPVSFLYEPAFISESGSASATLADGDDSGEFQTAYIVIQYVYSDGRTAASSDIAEVIPGVPVNHSVPVPTIVGYKATLENAGGHATIDGNTLKVSFAADEIVAGEYQQIKVVYQPDYVKYTIIHYWQNVENDRYSIQEREVVDFYDSDLSDNDRAHKTGEAIDSAHKNYPGFYHLLYETPAAAADGSTVIEVYYDRYYYLMKFDLGEDAYGVYPVYARYGDSLDEIGTPTRPGYTFMGWTLNGVDAEIPATMPAENRTYTAKWRAVDQTTVKVIIWGENADDEGYSYITTEEISAKPGDVINYESLKYDCGYVAHTHSSSCGYDCGYVDHEHSAACYSCGQAEHSHGRACYTVSGGTLSNDAETNETWLQRLNDADPYDDDGQIYRARSNNNSDYRYYLKIGNSYYRINFGRGQSINNFTYSLSCGNTEHTHGSGCGYICGRAEHSHTVDCFACGLAEHTHTNQCETDLGSMDTNLWTYVKSDTVTVNANGTSVINVYYDRISFTIDFYDGSRNNANNRVYSINAKWGADISGHWPIPGYTAGERWQPYDSSVYSAVLVFIAVMPQDSFDLVVNDASYDPYDMHYMLEVLPGESGTSYTYNRVTKYFKNEFSISAKYNYVTEDEDFFPLEGFDQWTSNPTFSNGQIENGNKGTDVYFYYSRHLYAIEFYNPTELLKKETGVAYGMELGGYDFTPTPEQAPDVHEPGSVRFAGWYLNSECTGDEYILADHTMPSAEKNGDTSLVLYAKWEPVEYKVNFFLDRDSMETGETIPEEMERLVNEAIESGKIAAKPADDPYSVLYVEDIVKHGGFLGNPGDPDVAEGYEGIHPYTGYEFIGWFYLGDDGGEVAFDPLNIPVNRHLNLYAKWNANTLCTYNIYFALDENGDGVADTDNEGNIIYVADSITGSAIAGLTYTFNAKGGEDLYNLGEGQNYREGYFPAVSSHSLTLDITDTEGLGANSFTFLYRQKAAVPYVVKYIDKETGESLFADKRVDNNRNVIVTENFIPKQGYMPEDYQISLIVTDDGNEDNDVIIFYYTKDEEHALYVVNYYIQDLNDQLNHRGWTKYTDLQYTGTIGEDYYADAINIDGFTLSTDHTDKYNTVDKINGMSEMDLPSEVSSITDGRITGELTGNGMELNFYYTRNLYPYEFRYMLDGTTIQLAKPTLGIGGYDTYVTGVAKNIVMDLDDDGVNEDYRLYDPTEVTKDIHIITDGEPLEADDEVVAGQATINLATFYYVRCTQTMTVTKNVVDMSADSNPDPDTEFSFSLIIHAGSGYHRDSYSYTVSEGETEVRSGTLSPLPSEPNRINFSLKDGQTITIDGLPTAEYSIDESNLPVGYYEDEYVPARRNTLTVDGQLDVTVKNSYDPSTLEISKTVDVVEDNDNIPEVENFFFTLTVPSGVSGEYAYTLGGETRSAEVKDGKIVFSLKNGEAVRFLNLPLGTYTVEEDNYKAFGYNSCVSLNNSAYTDSMNVSTVLFRGDDDSANFRNIYPVGDLRIEKTVTKQFYGTVWNGDSFNFTIERTTAGRPLITGNTYDVYEGGVKIGSATVDAEGKMLVTINFNADDAAKLDEASEQGNGAVRSYVIKNLPAGEYSVVEAENADYNQSALNVSGLEIPADTAPVARFTNKLIRPNGSLCLEKELVAAEGFNPDNLPTDQVFSFSVELTEMPPQGAVEITVSKNGGAAEAAQMVNGKFSIELMKDEWIRIDGLPVGNYRISETTIPHYANNFAHKENEAWVPKPAATTDDGRLCTDIVVPGEDVAEVKCTNTYPVDTAELVIQKLVTKNYDRDTLPEDSFIFTVTLAKEERGSYSYKIYNPDGSIALDNQSAAVSNKSFSIPLMAGQYAVIEDMPVCEYTVSENASAADYTGSYEVYLSECENNPATEVNTNGEPVASGEGFSFSRTFSAGKVESVVFTNEYRRHLGTLTITKTATGGNADDTFLFHIKGADASNSYIDMDVTIDGSGSVKIYDMPLGSYIVTEDSSWSWRWLCSSDLSGKELISIDDLHAEIAFENSFDEDRWLNGTSCRPNVFGKKDND